VHRPSGGVVFAVADGVSSAESADSGALDACSAAVRDILGQLDRSAWPLDLRKAVASAAGVLRKRAARRLRMADPPDEQVEKLYATTLVAGAVLPGPAGPGDPATPARPTAALVRVGDSCAWVLDRVTGEYRPLFRPKSGQVVMSNAVTALPRVPAVPEQVTLQLEPRLILLAGTDGFGDPLGDGTGQVGALFAGHLIPAPPRPLSFASLLDFSRETYDDDRALVAVWTHPEPT
jgi:hypothetical protein